jgi:hypothetical protein
VSGLGVLCFSLYEKGLATQFTKKVKKITRLLVFNLKLVLIKITLLFMFHPYFGVCLYVGFGGALSLTGLDFDYYLIVFDLSL